MREALYWAIFLGSVLLVGYAGALIVGTKKFWREQTALREEYRSAPLDFVLVLRPFAGQIFYEEEGPWSFGSSEAYFRLPPKRVIADLVDVLWILGVPLLVGPVRAEGPDDIVDAIQAFVHRRNWFDLFVRLCDGARSIVVLCEGSPGLQSEFDHIHADRSLLAKTLFIVPPRTRDPSRWDSISANLAAMGVLPTPELAGGAITMSVHANPSAPAVYFDGELDWGVLARGLSNLKVSIPSHGRPVSWAIEEIEKAEVLSGIVSWYVGQLRSRSE